MAKLNTHLFGSTDTVKVDKPFSDINLILRNYTPKPEEEFTYAVLCNVVDAENNSIRALNNSEISMTEYEANCEVLRPLRVFLKSKLNKNNLLKPKK